MATFTFNTTRHPLPEKRERIAVGNTVVGVNPTTYTIPSTERSEQRLASAAVIQVRAQGIYWTVDGSDPSTSVGFESAPGDFIYLDSGTKLRNFKAIRSGAADGAVEVLALFGS